MKKPLFLIVMLVIILSFASRIQAQIPVHQVTGVSSGDAAPVPPFPAAAKENGVVCADVNEDGVVNVLDVISIVNIILQVQGMPCGCIAPVVCEGKTYATVQIAEQCWFSENLNVGTMISSNQGGQLQTDNGIIEK